MKYKLILFLALICVNSLLNSTTWHIKLDGTGDFTTIQQGINASTNSDTLLVYPGTYYENINYNGKNITVASLELTTNDQQYISQTVIDGQRISSCISLISNETNACIRGLTITNGQGGPSHPLFGGGLSICGDYPEVIECEIVNCEIYKNYAYNSAGLCIYDANVNLSGCSIRDNNAVYVGGGMSVQGRSVITFNPNNRCSVYNNIASTRCDILLVSLHIFDFDVIVDTFTVIQPNDYFIGNNIGVQTVQYNYDILNYSLEPINEDLYVSPNGDDSNSGLTENEPLKTINFAVRNIASNPESQNTIFLSSGIYDISNNDQRLPFGCKAYVNIIGEDQETTIIDGEMETYSIFHSCHGHKNSLIKNITFRNSHPNSAVVGITYSDNLRFENITIKDCIISSFGAGLLGATNCGNVELVNIKIDNIEAQVGSNSGAWINGTSSFKAANCTFSNNTITGGACSSAGLYVDGDGDVIIENCKFINNSGPCPTYFGYASALTVNDYNGEIGNVYINNNLFQDNHIENGRGTIYIDSEPNSSIHFSNNTAVENISSYGVSFNGNMYLQNNILRNPGNYEIGLLYDTYPNFYSTLYSSYNDIEGGPNAVFSDNNSNVIYWEEGTIDAVPQFLQSGDDPYQLTEGSACIDTGTQDTTGLFLPPWDLLYNQRVWDGDGNGVATIDMGCYEFGAEPYVGIEFHEIPISSPDNTSLYNYPNPFNPSTTIKLELAEAGKTELAIYNIKGQKVKTLLDCNTAPGTYECNWNGKDETGKVVSSGQYVVKLKQNEKETATKIMLLK